MQTVNEWIRSLLLTVLAVGGAKMLLPAGQTKKAVELLLGLCVTLALLSPLGGIGRALAERFEGIGFPDTHVSEEERGTAAARIMADRLGEKMAEKHGLAFLGLRVECEERGGKIAVTRAYLTFPEGTPLSARAAVTAEVTAILECGVSADE